MPKVVRKITIRIRKPVHITLAWVKSSTDPTKRYEIALDRHNVVFCTCKGWRYNGHTCSHLTAFRAMLSSAKERLVK